MNPLIKNCVFGFQCPKSWDTLKALEESSNIKHCDKCDKSVFLCESEQQLNDAIEKGVCVALDFVVEAKEVRLLGYPSKARISSFLGDGDNE